MTNVVITGASKGFGRALANEFLKLGDSVVICSRNTDRVNDTVNKLKEKYPSGIIFGTVCDVTQYQNVLNLAEFAEKNLGSIDIWINNAGINGSVVKPLVDINEDIIRSVVETNLIGTLFGTQVALKRMLKQNSGKIVNLEGLGSDKMVIENLCPYISTKAAIPKIRKTVSKELKGMNVGIHSISPGMMITDLIGKETNPEAAKIMNILGETPEVVAEIVVPKIKKIKGSGKKISFLTGMKAMGRFMTARKRKNRFYDENGKCLIEIQ